jgi:hypothetical protein
MSVHNWAKRGELAFDRVGAVRAFPVSAFIHFIGREIANRKRARWLRRLAAARQELSA